MLVALLVDFQITINTPPVFRNGAAARCVAGIALSPKRGLYSDITKCELSMLLSSPQLNPFTIHSENIPVRVSSTELCRSYIRSTSELICRSSEVWLRMRMTEVGRGLGIKGHMGLELPPVLQLFFLELPLPSSEPLSLSLQAFRFIQLTRWNADADEAVVMIAEGALLNVVEARPEEARVVEVVGPLLQSLLVEVEVLQSIFVADVAEGVPSDLNPLRFSPPAQWLV